MSNRGVTYDLPKPSTEKITFCIGGVEFSIITKNGSLRITKNDMMPISTKAVPGAGNIIDIR